jgi:hypothetical protein
MAGFHSFLTPRIRGLRTRSFRKILLANGLAAPTLCNEAETSSIALRLAGSPRRASPWGLLLSTPGWLYIGHLFDMLITFQINREASLGLAHRITQMGMNSKNANLSY